MALSVRDTTFTTDIEQYFHQAMLSEGIEPDRVQISTYCQDQFTNEKLLIQVGKEINGELRTIKTGLTVSASAPTDRIRNQLAMAAHDAAVEFEDAMVEMIETCGTRLRFCAAEGGWVECEFCGTRVTLTGMKHGRLGFTDDAELSHPAPTPYDIQRFLRKLDDGQQEVLKLYLLGALRNDCSCGFGKRGRIRKGHRKI